MIIKNIIHLLICTVVFFVFVFKANAQDKIILTDVKSKRCYIYFSLQNIGCNNFEFDPVFSYIKDKFSPHYYFYIKDTLIINLENRKNEIQSDSNVNAKIIIDGERRNTNFILKPYEKLYFKVQKNKNNKIKFIKILLSNSETLYFLIDRKEHRYFRDPSE